VGQPTVEGASVRAQVVGDEKGKKIDVGVYKRRNKFRKKIGYRIRSRGCASWTSAPRRGED